MEPRERFGRHLDFSLFCAYPVSSQSEAAVNLASGNPEEAYLIGCDLSTQFPAGEGVAHHSSVCLYGSASLKPTLCTPRKSGTICPSVGVLSPV